MSVEKLDVHFTNVRTNGYFLKAEYLLLSHLSLN